MPNETPEQIADRRKQDFIDDYVDAASESPHGSRNPDEIQSDAEADWEATQIDAAYERHVQAKLKEGL